MATSIEFVLFTRPNNLGGSFRALRNRDLTYHIVKAENHLEAIRKVFDDVPNNHLYQGKGQEDNYVTHANIDYCAKELKKC